MLIGNVVFQHQKFSCYLYYLYWMFVPECRCQWQHMKTIPEYNVHSDYCFMQEKGMELVFIYSRPGN